LTATVPGVTSLSVVDGASSVRLKLPRSPVKGNDQSAGAPVPSTTLAMVSAGGGGAAILLNVQVIVSK